MSDDKQPAPSITLSFGDPKTWLVLAAMIGGPAAVNKLSLSSVETQQERVADTAKEAVVKQASIDDKLQQLSSKQDQIWGEMRWRQEQTEKTVRELSDAIDSKKGTK